MLFLPRSLPFVPRTHVHYFNEVSSTRQRPSRSSPRLYETQYCPKRLTLNDRSCADENGKQVPAYPAADGNGALQHGRNIIWLGSGHTDSTKTSAHNITPTYYNIAIAYPAYEIMPPASRQWVSSDANELRRLHRGRVQVCPRSPFLMANFNLIAHKAVMAAAKKRRKDGKLYYDMRTAERRQAEQRRTFPLPPAPIRPAFDGKEFSTNQSAVLLCPTVFVPSFWKGKDGFISDWPTPSEMKYEGDERISTDKLHARFPPAPRVPGNGTVNWQQRTIIKPDAFDNFHTKYDEWDIKIRGLWIADMEFDDEEGKEAIGEDLMEMMDYKDIW